MASFTSTAYAVLATEAGEEPNPLVPHLSELVIGLVAFTLLNAMYISGALADEH
jgi:hypothetical protein